MDAATIRRGLTTAALVVACFLGASHRAAGQTNVAGTATVTATTATATATVSVTGTPTGPAAADLVSRSSVAVSNANTFHVTGVIALRLSGKKKGQTVTITDKEHGDESIKPARARMLATIVTKGQGTTSIERIRDIMVGAVLASKTNHKKWTCSKAATSTSSLTGVLVSSLQSAQLVSQQTLGSATVDGLPVWHVQMHITVTLQGAELPVTADDYISQTDYTLVRAIATLSTTVQGLTLQETATNDYSKYGETVSATLPKVCSSKRPTVRDRVLASIALPQPLPKGTGQRAAQVLDALRLFDRAVVQP